MNKVLMGLRFKSYWVVWFLAFYLPIYILTMSIVSYFLIDFNVINRDEGSLLYRIWPLVGIQFGVSIAFKTDYDFMLTMSCSRKTIFKSLIAFNMAFSAIVSLLILTERVVVDLLNGWLHFNNPSDIFHFFSPYKNNNLALQFLFFFTLSACLSTLGLLFGSLLYRFGLLYRWAFWVGFSTLPLLLLPTPFWLFLPSESINTAWQDMWSLLGHFDLLTSTNWLILLTLLFAICAYLNIRRLSQQ